MIDDVQMDFHMEEILENPPPPSLDSLTLEKSKLPANTDLLDLSDIDKLAKWLQLEKSEFKL